MFFLCVLRNDTQCSPRASCVCDLSYMFYVIPLSVAILCSESEPIWYDRICWRDSRIIPSPYTEYQNCEIQSCPTPQSIHFTVVLVTWVSLHLSPSHPPQSPSLIHTYPPKIRSQSFCLTLSLFLYLSFFSSIFLRIYLHIFEYQRWWDYNLLNSQNTRLDQKTLLMKWKNGSKKIARKIKAEKNVTALSYS